jgi:hypothetical protein
MRLQRDLACFVEQYHIMELDFILVWWWKEVLWVSIFPISEKIKGVLLRILLTIRG